MVQTHVRRYYKFARMVECAIDEYPDVNNGGASSSRSRGRHNIYRYQLIRVLLLNKKAQSCLRITDISTDHFPALATQNGDKRAKEMFSFEPSLGPVL